MSSDGAVAETFLMQKPVPVAQIQFTHATRSPRARQVAFSVVCESYIEIAAGIGTRGSAATEKSFFKLVFEYICG